MTENVLQPRRALQPAPGDWLTQEQVQACLAWKRRWGDPLLTREPDEGKTLLRFEPARFPLVELVNRRAYDRLRFARWLAAAERGREA